MRKLTTTEQSIHTHMLMMEHFLVDMLDNINIARHDLNHHSRNAAIGALMHCAEAYNNLGTLYQAVITLHRNAEAIDREDD